MSRRQKRKVRAFTTPGEKAWLALQRGRSCWTPSKTAFESERAAKTEAAIQAGRHGVNAGVYQCRCEAWHLTTIGRERT